YDKRVSLKEVIEKAQQSTGASAYSAATSRYPELFAALYAVLPPRAQLDTTSLGAWMRSKRDKIVGGMRIKKEKGKRETDLWWVEQTGGADSVPPSAM